MFYISSNDLLSILTINSFLKLTEHTHGVSKIFVWCWIALSSVDCTNWMLEIMGVGNTVRILQEGLKNSCRRIWKWRGVVNSVKSKLQLWASLPGNSACRKLVHPQPLESVILVRFQMCKTFDISPELYCKPLVSKTACMLGSDFDYQTS